MSKKMIEILSVGVIALALFGAGFVAGSPLHTHEVGFAEDHDDRVQFLINSGDAVRTFEIDLLREEMSIFDVLLKAVEEEKISFQYQDFGSEIGIFVESIDSKANTIDTWWQFWVNGERGAIDVGRSHIHPGDLVYFVQTGNVID